MTDATTAQPTLHHVTLKTTRLQTMVDWYGLVVSLRPTFQSQVGAWLTSDAANHRLSLLAFPGQSDDPQKQSHTGLHHSAYEFASLANLLAAYSRLKGHGMTPAFTLDHGMTLSIYYPDPDGNLLELQVDTFADWAASTQWMASAPEFAANPIGVQFDPDRLVLAQAEGLSDQEIHCRAYAGEYAPANPVDLGT